MLKATAIKGTVIGIDGKPVPVDPDGIAIVAGLRLKLFRAETGDVWGYPPDDGPRLSNLRYVGTIDEKV